MEQLNIKSDVVVDAKKLCCPMPAVKTCLQLEKMENGQILEVITTDPVSQTDLPAWCKNTGNELLGIKNIGDTAHIYIKKTA